MPRRFRWAAPGAVLVIALSVCTPDCLAREVGPSSTLTVGERVLERFSERTLVVAISVDRDAARLSGFTVKERPFLRARGAGPEPAGLRVDLLGPGGERFTAHAAPAGLCLEHGPDAAPHLSGDRVLAHRATALVELPELPGFAQVEVSRAGEVLGSFELEPALFTPAGGSAGYETLAFAGPAALPHAAAPLARGSVHWPEEYDDPDVVAVYGDAAETGQRVNVVIVPDGYTYDQKSLMEAHARNLVLYLERKPPFGEHRELVNYILVYAYSAQSGADACDCPEDDASHLRDTAMNAGFPGKVATCEDPANRRLYYDKCDGTGGEENIVAAELRAPAHDVTLLMVNTDRRGGSAGTRGAYSAAHQDGLAIAAHELAHAFANLDDEYVEEEGCGSEAGEINTTLDQSGAAWAEWLAELGPPREGAQYYPQCVYRPDDSCAMREDSHPFCAVCRQRLALAFFENPRVATAAPVAWTAPASPVTTDELVEFEVGARVGLAPAAYAWTVEGPGLPAEGALEATGTTSFLRRFTAPGAYTVTCRVTADADWVKPERAGANLATITWRVYVGDDEDHDARADSVDNCPAVANANQRDTDGDGSGDACDADDDADGVPDGSDNCPLAANPGQQDGDADGVGDVCEADTDDDGVPDAADDCPLQADAAQDDADLDGTGDACELDDDADSVPDAGDNCPRVLNPSQLDSDGDGTGNACDADADGDGVLERDDNCPRAANADQADLDGDGSGNACDGDYDGDGDGVPDLQDNCPAAENADQADGDRDGVGDACDPLRMLGPAADTVVYTDVAPRFCWDTGPRGKYFVEWSRKEEFGSVKKTLVAFDLGCYQPVLDWLKVLKLADDSGQFYWRVRAKSSSERLVTPASRLVLSPVIAPEITGPASDEPLDCADDPPEIDWDGNHNTRFRVLFSATADMKQPVRVPSDGYGLFSTAVTLTSAQWRNVCKLVGGAGTVYARLDAKDNLDRRSSSQPRPLTIVTTDEGLVANP